MNSKLLGVSLLLTSTASVAMPTVKGNIIAWPDDGWYQVQNAETYQSICEGGTFCIVDPGTYKVINHSTGERFANIQIGSESTATEVPAPAVGSVTVSGNTISWPNDGWYQVQDSTNYQTICEGGTSCVAVAGTYTVINHSTGERFNDIQVSDADSPTPVVDAPDADSAITVNGSVVSWPSDGWYQLQSATTFATICEGGTSCEVLPGVYQLINHSTGQRWENIEIVGGGTVSDVQFSTPDQSGATDLARISLPTARDTSRDIVSGSYLDMYFDSYQEIRDLQANAAGGSSVLLAALQAGVITENVVVPEFSCDDGGTANVAYKTGNSRLVAEFTTTFNNCVVDGLTLDGTLVSSTEGGRFGAGSSITIRSDFQNLSLLSDELNVTTLVGYAERVRLVYASGMVSTAERGSCVFSDSRKVINEHNITSALVQRPGSGAIAVLGNEYSLNKTIEYLPTSDEDVCPIILESVEIGTADASFQNYRVNGSTFNGVSTISTNGSVDTVANVGTFTAAQNSTLPDGSSLTLTALSPDSCDVQVDVMTGGAALSFNDEYCFPVNDLQEASGEWDAL